MKNLELRADIAENCSFAGEIYEWTVPVSVRSGTASLGVLRSNCVAGGGMVTGVAVVGAIALPGALAFALGESSPLSSRHWRKWTRR